MGDIEVGIDRISEAHMTILREGGVAATYQDGTKTGTASLGRQSDSRRVPVKTSKSGQS